MKRGVRSAILAITISCLTSVTGTMAANNPASFDLHHDSVPNFAQSPTIQSTQNGNWSSASTWNPARVPQAGDIVLISHNVIYDTMTGNVDVIGIEASAALRFKTNQNTTLKVGTLLVMPDGTLEVGTTGSPIANNVTANIIIKDHPLDLTNDNVGVYDPEQFGTGILVINGTWTMHGSTKSSTFVRLSEEPLAGTTQLKLSIAVEGWKSGDRLILPDTRHLNSGHTGGTSYVPEWEELTVSSISGDGKTVTLTKALKFDHLGARDANNHLEFLPHVGNLTRNIAIQSENPKGTRGHTQAHHNADIDIRYAAFKDLGRTKNEELNNTTFNNSGTVSHIGKNQIARYPIHTHHLRGAVPTPSNGYQFTLIGNAVDGGTDKHNLKWGMTIHGSHYGLIRENVVYNMAGAGIAFEDGSETHNVLEKNFVMRIRGTGMRADVGCDYKKIDCGREGAGFWFRGPNNYVRDNVAANMPDRYAFTINAKWTGEVTIPAYQGADPNHGGTQATTIHLNGTPILEFARNEAYGASKGGMVYWWIGTDGAASDGPQDVPRSYIKDFVAWHTETAIFGYASHRLTIDHPVIRGDKTTATKGKSIGYQSNDYLQKSLIIQNADIQGVQTGIMAPILIEPRYTPKIGFVTIKDSLIRAYYGITVIQPWHNNDPSGMNPREIHIRNVKFESLGVSPNNNAPPYHGINMDPTTLATNLIVPTKVFVYNYNQLPGEDFQVYSPEQDPNYVVPKTILKDNGTPKVIGSPNVGLTNTQNKAKHGIAMAGEITPCLDKSSYPEMRGFVCNGSASTNQLDTTPPVVPVGFQVM